MTIKRSIELLIYCEGLGRLRHSRRLLGVMFYQPPLSEYTRKVWAAETLTSEEVAAGHRLIQPEDVHVGWSPWGSEQSRLSRSQERRITRQRDGLEPLERADGMTYVVRACPSCGRGRTPLREETLTRAVLALDAATATGESHWPEVHVGLTLPR